MNGKRYFTFESFESQFGQQMDGAWRFFRNLKAMGIKNNARTTIDFTFCSNKKRKLKALENELINRYNYKITSLKWKFSYWLLDGATHKMFIDEENVLFWIIDMYRLGFEHDCLFEGYGSLVKKESQEIEKFEKTREKEYLEKGLKDLNEKVFISALLNFKRVLKVNPKNPDAYLNLGYVKSQLFLIERALKDYDKAIELEPNCFISYLNRGAIKDELKDYKGALSDYENAIKIQPNEPDVYINRGNTKWHMGDKDGACQDWNKAKEFGGENANDIINEHCK